MIRQQEWMKEKRGGGRRRERVLDIKFGFLLDGGANWLHGESHSKLSEAGHLL